MGLLLSDFFFDHLPSASCFMSLFSRMSTTTAKTIVLHSNSIFSLFKGKAYFLTSKNISIEIFTENLSCFIIDFILRINHDHILSPDFIKYFPDDLRMTWINKNQSWNSFFLRKKYFSNFLCIYRAKRSDCKLWIILKLQLSLFWPMTYDMKYLWLF